MGKNNPYAHLEDGGKTYIDVRPSYPHELIAKLKIDPETKVLDIGAGTGKLTAQLLKYTDKVWALEPSVKIADGFFRTLPNFPRTNFICAKAEDTGRSRREFDLVVFGQCWHWLDAPAASREAARILVPRGKIGIFFNQLDVSIPWVLHLSRIMRSGDVQKISKPPQLTRDFSKPQLQLTNWIHHLSVSQVLLLGQTRASWIRSDTENRTRMQHNLRRYLCAELGYGESDTVELPYQTLLWTAEKRF